MYVPHDVFPGGWHAAERLLHAELPGAQHDVDQVLVHVVLYVGQVEDLLVALVHVRRERLRALCLEVPVAHREVLQHVHPHRDASLYSDHAATVDSLFASL